jgi:hypothetical protein
MMGTFDIHDPAIDFQKVSKMMFFQNITINWPGKEFLWALINAPQKLHCISLNE